MKLAIDAKKNARDALKWASWALTSIANTYMRRIFAPNHCAMLARRRPPLEKKLGPLASVSPWPRKLDAGGGACRAQGTTGNAAATGKRVLRGVFFSSARQQRRRRKKSRWPPANQPRGLRIIKACNHTHRVRRMLTNGRVSLAPVLRAVFRSSSARPTHAERRRKRALALNTYI